MNRFFKDDPYSFDEYFITCYGKLEADFTVVD